MIYKFLSKNSLRAFWEKIYNFLKKQGFSKKDPFSVFLGIGLIFLFGTTFLGSNSGPKNNFSASAADKQTKTSNFSSNNADYEKTAKYPYIKYVGGAVSGAEENSINLSKIQDFSLVGFYSPTDTFTLEEGKRREIIEYAVEAGDTLSSIADRFEISLNTLLWANDLNKNSPLKIGQKLVILPVSGALHSVKKGETLSEIAQKYKAKLGEIIALNELTNEDDISIGDNLIIPNGILPPLEDRIAYKDIVPLADSYFICPVAAPCRLTQGLHYKNAVDISHGKCGEPIYAVAGGEVSKIKYGYNNGAGNYIKILHPNGVVTFYGHIEAALVSAGQAVSQGDIIALMGGKPGTLGAGRSTGCHTHFGVEGARNPFAR